MDRSRRRFGGIKDLFNDNLRQRLSALPGALGSIGRISKLQDDEPFVTLQVGKRVFEAAPRQMRIELWMSSLQRKGIGVAAAHKYEDMLLTPVSEEAASDIEKDLARTFPSTKRFAATEGQEALRRVLMAYAAYDPEVGYCQGMNFVAGLLLMYLPERHAFGGLVVLMHDRGLRKYYSTDMSLLQTHLWQLGRLMPAKLCAHLESCGVLPLLYGASWLMTCFSADFPASFSARILDVIMSDKMSEALLKVAVGLLVRCQGRLMGLRDMEDCLALIKLELPGWDESQLHDVLSDAFSSPWSAGQLALLGSVEGAESVAEALERVQRTNLAAAATGADTPPRSPAAEAAGAAAAAGQKASAAGSAGSAGTVAPGGERLSDAAGGSSGGGVVPQLLGPPPPSPKRLLHSGANSQRSSQWGSEEGTGRGSGRGLEAELDRGFDRGLGENGAGGIVADRGSEAGSGVGLPGLVGGQEPRASGAAANGAGDGAGAAAGRGWPATLDMPAAAAAGDDLLLIDMSSPRAGEGSTAAAAAAVPAAQAAADFNSAGAAAAASQAVHLLDAEWDPFGCAVPNPAGSGAPALQAGSGAPALQAGSASGPGRSNSNSSSSWLQPWDQQHQQQHHTQKQQQQQQHHGKQQQQQQQHTAKEEEQHQQQLRQQLEDLSFSQLTQQQHPGQRLAGQQQQQQQQQHHRPHRHHHGHHQQQQQGDSSLPSLHLDPQQQHQQEQTQQQQQQQQVRQLQRNAASMYESTGKAAPAGQSLARGGTGDEWWDFQASPTVQQQQQHKQRLSG